MDSWTDESEAAFDACVEALIGVIGRADRAEPLKDYCLGLLLPMAAQERGAVSGGHRAISGSSATSVSAALLAQAPWSDPALIAWVGE
jgi:SRSO17 transposase